MKSSFIIRVILLAFIFSPVYAADLKSCLDNAEQSLSRADLRMADFWMARYLGQGGETKSAADFLVRRSPSPSGFLSSLYDDEFVDWFVSSARGLWGVTQDRVREARGTVEVASSVFGDHFAAVSAAPELQYWYVQKGEGMSPPLLMVVGSSRTRVALLAGRLSSGRPAAYFPAAFLNMRKHALQYVWPPEFADLDGDRVPELWVRYNLLWSNGYQQVLDVFRINAEGPLTLLKEFRGENEGTARRLPDNRVEVATGFGSRKGLAHLNYDRHTVTAYIYKEGEFVKDSSKVVPHLLQSKAWKDTL